MLGVLGKTPVIVRKALLLLGDCAGYSSTAIVNRGGTILRRVMVGLALAMSLIAVLGSSGCASASPQTQTQGDEFASYVDELQSLPGVEHVTVNANDPTSSASLTVQVRDDVEADALAVIGEKVTTFSNTAAEHGFVASNPVIRLGESNYSYFEDLSTEQVTEQLNYWLSLIRVGVDGVQVHTYRSHTNIPAQGSIGAEPEAEQPPRYVLVKLPTDIAESELRNLIDGLAAAADPGAPGGQWDFLNLAPHTKGEYAEPNFPSTTELSYAVTTGNHFAEVDGMANVEVLRDAGNDTPLRIRIAVFDDTMDGVDSDHAEAIFEHTEAWSHVIDLVALLEGAGTLNYGVEVLANPLADGGNFHFDFSVQGCEFHTDSTWPTLATALTSAWEEHASDARYEEGSQCERPKSEPNGDAQDDDEATEETGDSPDSVTP